MNHRDAVEFLGILLLATCSLVFAALWWSAYLTQNAVFMTINQYGEATVEAGVWFVATPIMLYAVSSYLRRLAAGSAAAEKTSEERQGTDSGRASESGREAVIDDRVEYRSGQ